MNLRISFLTLLLLCFIACAAAGPAKKKEAGLFISEEEEISLGKRLDKIVLDHYGYYQSLKLQDYINSIGQSLAGVSDRPQLTYRFKVLNSSDINSFSLPGGYVYITRGLLCFLNSEAELAYILGYEVGHINARHGIKKYTQENNSGFAKGLISIFFSEFKDFDLACVIFEGISKGYGRESELEAISLSRKYMLKAGYSPDAVKCVLKTLSLIKESGGKNAKKDILFHKISSFLPEEKAKIYNTAKYTDLKTGDTEYKKHIENLIFGDNPEDGIIIDGTFKHPGLHFSISFPEEWEIENRSFEIWAKHETRDFFIQVTFHPLDKYNKTGEIAKKIAKRLKLSLISGEETEINALPAFIGDYKGSHYVLGQIQVKAAFINMEDKIYYILCYTKKKEFSLASGYFEQVIESFYRLPLHKIK
ncbi:MAG: M48 family metalloprotease, partial [Thermodesulfobacteriota bacterium]|nr:M48 family metalloprotease [Thermodesulfobacteriota bacterium]